MSREMRYFSLALTLMLPVAAFAQSVPGTDRQFDVYVIHDVMVPMRDGVKLATDVYLPAVQGQPLPGPWPTVVERTPYGKGAFLANTPTGADYAKRGYALVVQDVRGRYNSEGVFLSYSQEGPDGLDTMQWIHDQPWCNRRIGVTGSSYFASTAQAILVQNAPGLAAGIIRVGPGNYHEDGAWNGGTFLLAHNVNYALSLALVGKEAAADAAVGSAIAAASRPPAAFHLMIQSPLAPGAAPFGLAPSYDAWYQDWQDHELFDSYWQTIGNSFTDHYSRSPDVPILLVSEWYDAFLGGALDGYQGYTRSHHSPVHMIIGGGEQPGAAPPKELTRIRASGIRVSLAPAPTSPLVRARRRPESICMNKEDVMRRIIPVLAAAGCSVVLLCASAARADDGRHEHSAAPTTVPALPRRAGV